MRGSRHAWDIRLISAEALIKLIQLKENPDDPETGRKIRGLLTPFEYTRLDRLIDTMFTAATDIEVMVESELPGENDDSQDTAGARAEKGVWQFTASNLLNDKRELMIAAVSRSVGSVLVKKSRALFWSADHHTRIACTISKRYTKRNAYPYWYAFHPQWDEFLREGKDAFAVFGCMDLPFAFSIPFGIFRPVVDGLNTTQKEDGSSYWHVHIAETAPDTYSILLPKKSSSLPIDAFRVSEG